jgi:hypothetical protein
MVALPDSYRGKGWRVTCTGDGSTLIKRARECLVGWWGNKRVKWHHASRLAGPFGRRYPLHIHIALITGAGGDLVSNPRYRCRCDSLTVVGRNGMRMLQSGLLPARLSSSHHPLSAPVLGSVAFLSLAQPKFCVLSAAPTLPAFRAKSHEQVTDSSTRVTLSNSSRNGMSDYGAHTPMTCTGL